MSMVDIIKRTAKKSKESDEYGTPRWIYDYVDKIFNFDMDVCASKKNHKHENYITIKQDALNPKTPWGIRNWCNPPYSNILPWYERAIKEADMHGAMTVFLSKWDHSTKHGQLVLREFNLIFFIAERIKFEGADSSCNFPCFIGVVKRAALCHPDKFQTISLKNFQ